VDEHIREAFARELERPGGIDLPAAALALGLIARPDLARAAARLEALALEVVAEIGHPSDVETAVTALAEALGERRGFRGDTDDYDDPHNCFVHETLIRRRGMPIALTVIYMAVGARCRLRIDAIGLPWHVIARAGDEEHGYVYFDPFAGGQALSRPQIAAFLESRGVPAGGRLDTYLAALTPRQVLTRMLYNIKRVYLERRDDRRAWLATDLLLTITPWAIDELRDRGLLSARLGEIDRARADLTLYLDHAPDARDAARVAALLRALDR
jgi:regulator of sirC expression with transglutaminase-like and TPR domain